MSVSAQTGSALRVRPALGEQPLVALVALGAALPVLFATVRTLGLDWLPTGDQAVVATRAFDVLTSETPLVGAATTASTLTEQQTNFLGPMLYWLLAVPARLSPSALPIVMGAVNVAAVVGTVLVARRRGGLALMVATAVALAVLCGAYETQVLHDIWPPAAALLPFTLLVVLCWSLACGEHRLLPLAALLGSFVAQTHLAYVLPTLAAFAVGIGGLLLHARHDLRALRAPLLGALAVTVVCWSFPVADQVLAWSGSERGQGNLVNVYEASASRGETAGWEAGAHAVIGVVGLRPWWTRGPQSPKERTFAIFEAPSALALASGVIVLAGLVAAAVAGVRRRRRDVAAGCILALALGVALAAMTAGFPSGPENIFSYSHASWWAGPVGAFAWLVLGFSAVSLAGPHTARARLADRRLLLPAAVGVAALGAIAGASQGPEVEQETYRPAQAVVDRLDRVLPARAGAAVLVQGPSFGFETAVIYALRWEGAAVGTTLAPEFGRAYRVQGRRFTDVLFLREAARVPRGPGELIRVRVPGTPPRTLVVYLQRRAGL